MKYFTRSTPLRRGRAAIVGALTATAMLALSACGSDDDGDEESGEGSRRRRRRRGAHQATGTAGGRQDGRVDHPGHRCADRGVQALPQAG